MAASVTRPYIRDVRNRVLVVDDDVEHRLALRGVLERAGCEVLEAENGLVALDLCRACHPSIILLDIVMPVMDGSAFLEAKQADSRIMYIPVVVISAIDPCVGARVVRQLRKPVSTDMLLSVVRVVAASRWGTA